MPRLTGFEPVSVRGPRGLPFIGTQAAALRFLADPIGRMLALQRDFGDVAAICDRSPALVCAFGAERNREVLSNAAVFENDDQFLLETPPGSALGLLKNALTFQTGERHRRHRRLMMPAFHKAAIDGYAGDITAVTTGVLQTWPIGQTADVAELTRDLVQHVAVRCLFGLDWTDGDHRLGNVATETVDLLTSPLTVALPFRIPGTPYPRALSASEELVAHLRALIAEKRRQPSLGRDAMGLLLGARDHDGSTLSDDELIGEAAALFVAGHDTQAKTLAWTLFLLGQHPKVLGDLLDEIDAVLRGGPPAAEHLPRMVLLDRVIKESMRVIASVPLLFIRVLHADARLGAHTLPKDASVIVSPFVTHRDPARFPEPRRFKPERWEKLQPTPYEYLPYGTGPRMCIGASFATLALRLILPMILQRFRLTLAHGARISRLVRGNILSPRHGMPMLVAPQDRHFARRGGLRGDIPELLDLP